MFRRAGNVMYDKLTGAGLVRLIAVAAVITVAAHADGGGLRCGAAVGGALQTQTWTLGRLEGTRGARCGNRQQFGKNKIKQIQSRHKPVAHK